MEEVGEVVVVWSCLGDDCKVVKGEAELGLVVGVVDATVVVVVVGVGAVAVVVEGWVGDGSVNDKVDSWLMLLSLLSS